MAHGTPIMQDIAKSIREGADAFLKREFSIEIPIIIGIAVRHRQGLRNRLRRSGGAGDDDVLRQRRRAGQREEVHQVHEAPAGEGIQRGALTHSIWFR